MNNDDKWRLQLEQLKGAFSERPCLRSRVLQQLAQRSDSPQRTIGTVPSLGGVRWLPVDVGWATAGIGALAAGIMLVFWLWGSSATLAFADVQAALREIQTAIITREFPDVPDLNQRVLVSSGHDRYRGEMKSGAVFIQSREGKSLILNTKLRIGQITPGDGFGLEGETLAPKDLLRSLQKVEMNAVKSLGMKVFDGRELAGFELPPEDRIQRHVWVDLESHLPVREISPLKSDDPPNASHIYLRQPRSVVSYQFNVALADELFSLEVPEGYKLVESDEFQMPGLVLPNRPREFNPLDFVITPGQGIGVLRFGMTKQQVIAALGEPDSAEQFGGFTAEQQKAVDEMEKKAKDENWDQYRIHRERNRIANLVKSFVRAGDGMFYRSLGFWVSVRDDRGLEGFTCSHRTGLFQKFGGTTDRGISMDSTIADVKRVYGEPNSTFETKGAVTIVYTEMELAFSFKADGKMYQITMNRPKAN